MAYAVEFFYSMVKTVLLLFFSFTAAVYLNNLTRDIYSGDLGDLVTASFVAGVPHPPGYPLFTFLGFILSHLPVPLPIVSKVGLISVFSSLLGLFIFYKLSYRVSRDFLISLLSISILAFSYMFWLHSEIPEVFALNNFFALILFYLAVVFYQEKRIIHLYLFVFFLSLSLTHHQTILFIFPSLLILVIKHFKFIFLSKKRATLLLIFGILGLLPYAYIPIAALRNPVINWGDASSLENFIRLVLRKDYGEFAPNPFNVSYADLLTELMFVKDYLSKLIFTLTPPVIVLCLIGIARLFVVDKRILFSFLLGFLFSGPFFVFYGTRFVTNTGEFGVIERFYVLSSVTFLLFLPYGLFVLRRFFDAIFTRLFSKSTVYSALCIVILFSIPFTLFKDNFAKTDLSKTKIGNNLALDILMHLPRGSVIFPHTDTTTFNIWYAHHVLGIRPDIEIVNMPGAGGYSYQKYLAQNNNESSKGILLEFKEKVPVFFTYETSFGSDDLILVPRGLTFELIYKKNVPAKEMYIEQIEKTLSALRIPRKTDLSPSEKNLITPEITTFYSNGLLNIGNFVHFYYKDPKSALAYYQEASFVDYENYAAYANLAVSQYKALKDCKNSVKNIQNALKYYPISKGYYAIWYILHKKCKSDKKLVSAVVRDYQALFHKDIEDEVKKQQRVFKL